MGRNKKLARQRALLILSVRGGAMTAREGAKELSISRKTYYEWEDRALRAMASALENRPVGRPPGIRDPEKEELQERVKELEKKLYLAEKTMRSRSCYRPMRSFGQKKRQGQASREGGSQEFDPRRGVIVADEGEAFPIIGLIFERSW